MEPEGFLSCRCLVPGPFVLAPFAPVEIPAGFTVGLSRDGRIRAPGAEACCYPHIAAFTLIVSVVVLAVRILAALAFVFALCGRFGPAPL